MLFVRKDIPFILLVIEEKSIFYIELNLRNSKWLLTCSHNLQKNSIGTHLGRLNKSLVTFFPNYEKIIMFGVFNEIFL